MGNYIVLDIELGAIKDFLDKALDTVDTEEAAIYEREEAGEFPGIDDFSNALFNPMEREAIAIRAVFYEINALIEWELAGLASEAYSKSDRHARTPKFLGDVSLDKASHIKFVYDLSISERLHLIEEYYGVNFADMPGFAEFQDIRHAVNAFKHRKGFKDFRRDLGSEPSERFQPTREDAYGAIGGARSFLEALWKESLG